MHFTKFRQLILNAVLWQWRNRVKYIVLIGEHVKMRRNLVHWGSRDTVFKTGVTSVRTVVPNEIALC